MDDFPKEPPEPRLKVVKLPSADLPNTATMLRKMADDIDKGEYGIVHGAAVVLDAWQHPSFGFGSVDGTTFHLLCHIGMLRIARGTMVENGSPTVG